MVSYMYKYTSVNWSSLVSWSRLVNNVLLAAVLIYLRFRCCDDVFMRGLKWLVLNAFLLVFLWGSVRNQVGGA